MFVILLQLRLFHICSLFSYVTLFIVHAVSTMTCTD